MFGHVHSPAPLQEVIGITPAILGRNLGLQATQYCLERQKSLIYALILTLEFQFNKVSQLIYLINRDLTLSETPGGTLLSYTDNGSHI
jgi:hypothetical protein